MMCAFSTALGGIFASSKLFAQFLSVVMRNPLSFIQQYKTGAILNHCSQDMAELDDVVHFTLRSMLMVIMSSVGSVFIIIYTTPWALVTLPFLVPGYCAVQV